MGTFHDGKGELHGITVVATAGETVYVGRCDTVDGGHVVLLDGDQHIEGEDGRSNEEWLQRAARFGVWKKHDRLVLNRSAVTSVMPLGALVRGGAGQAQQAVLEEPRPAADQPAAADGSVVVLTEAAQDEVRRLLATEQQAGRGLRLGVAGGGCSGLVYKVEFDSRRDGDLTLPHDGFEVLLDKKSTIYLRGVVLDHQAGLAGRGFVFQNPNASNTCGCGESFAV